MSGAQLLHHLHELPSPLAAPLLDALTAALPGLSRARARRSIQAGLVRVDGAVELDERAAVAAGAMLRCDLRQGIPSRGALRHGGAEPARADAAPFEILHQDAAVIVIDKAAGVLAAPDPSERDRPHVGALLRQQLRRQGRSPRYLGPVHRIDAATSGCLLFACSKPAQRLLSTQFAAHGAGRRYRCLVAGGPRRDEDELRGRIGRGPHGRRALVGDDRPGKDAVTHFRVLRRWQHGSELECWLETGRTHQIRIQLAAIGCPVLGDTLYGQRRRGQPRVPRLMLHAWRLAFDHPETGVRCEYEAPLPPAFAAVARQLGPAKSPSSS